jgi:predicted transcriptional regulator
MQETNSITVRLTNEKAQLLNLLSSEYKRSKNFLVNEALDKYLSDETYHIQELLKSLKQADEGNLISHKKAMAEIDEFLNNLNKE